MYLLPVAEVPIRMTVVAELPTCSTLYRSLFYYYHNVATPRVYLSSKLTKIVYLW